MLLLFLSELLVVVVSSSSIVCSVIAIESLYFVKIFFNYFIVLFCLILFNFILFVSEPSYFMAAPHINIFAKKFSSNLQL